MRYRSKTRAIVNGLISKPAMFYRWREIGTLLTICEDKKLNGESKMVVRFNQFAFLPNGE